jgi:hypothetical protein
MVTCPELYKIGLTFVKPPVVGKILKFARISKRSGSARRYILEPRGEKEQTVFFDEMRDTQCLNGIKKYCRMVT